MEATYVAWQARTLTFVALPIDVVIAALFGAVDNTVTAIDLALIATIVILLLLLFLNPLMLLLLPPFIILF